MKKETLAEISIEKAFALVDTGVLAYPKWAKKTQVYLSINYGNYSFLVNKTRFDCFKKSVKCACCETVGEIAKLTKHKNSSDLQLDIYGRNKYGDLSVMTLDHIIPSSKGGDDSIENAQTLCTGCNKLKSDRIISNDNLMIDVLKKRKQS